MAKLPSISMLTIACAVLFIFIINHSSSARTIGNPTPAPHNNHYHKIAFLMRDVLNVTQPSSRPATAKLTAGQLPFQKPLGLFPPIGGIPLLGSNQIVPGTAAAGGLSTQTLDLSSIGLSFPARATLDQELEFGTVTVIDQELFKGSSNNVNMSPMVGKAQGIYVASSEDGSSHMMAMTAYFAGSGFKDGLRFFGVHKTDVPESHIAVIGGIGKYQGANGYATVKAVNRVGSHTDEEGKGRTNKLLFNVYLS